MSDENVQQTGNINVVGDAVDVGGDVVGRDKITHINIYPAAPGSDALLQDSQKFLAFLKNLWGALAALSVLFPLVNQFVAVIPISNPDYTPLEYIPMFLVTLITTIATLFIVLWTFNQRHIFAAQNTPQRLQSRAWAALGLGLLSLTLYLSAHFGINMLVYEPLGIWGADPRRLPGDMFLSATYCGFFGLTTRAFMLLGMAEFIGR